MTTYAKAISVALLGLSVAALFGQTAPSTLEIEVQNRAFYGNRAEYDKLASDPNPQPIPQQPAPAFGVVTAIGDIVALNGKPARGIWVDRFQVLQTSPSPQPGQTIADVSRFAADEHVFDILQLDGTWIGTITASGLSNYPSDLANTNGLVVTGGAGAYLGVRGAYVSASGGFGRATTTAEDPSVRRNFTGSSIKFQIQLIPLQAPQVLTNAGQPEMYHSDLSPITSANPARPGEVVILAAIGLGPTRPSGDRPGMIVNSPVSVIANGVAIDTINQMGWPGRDSVYRVDFRMPDVSAGMAPVRLNVAGIEGPEFQLPVGK